MHLIIVTPVGDVAPQILFFATSYVTPLALICGLYLCMLLRLWHGVAPGGHVSAESRRGKKRVTRMVVVVVAIFAICWFPIQVGQTVKRTVAVLVAIVQFDTTVSVLQFLLGYLNWSWPICNPFTKEGVTSTLWYLCVISMILIFYELFTWNSSIEIAACFEITIDNFQKASMQLHHYTFIKNESHTASSTPHIIIQHNYKLFPVVFR